MAYSFLVFDFDGNEDVAQQARHKIDGWRQGFRLDKKLQVKFDRNERQQKERSASKPATHSDEKQAGSKTKPRPKSKSKTDVPVDEEGHASEASISSPVRLIVRLDFSDHEKLSHQRWLERIPGEEPFKTVKSKIVRQGDPEFVNTSEFFDSLDRHAGGNQPKGM